MSSEADRHGIENNIKVIIERVVEGSAYSTLRESAKYTARPAHVLLCA